MLGKYLGLGELELDRGGSVRLDRAKKSLLCVGLGAWQGVEVEGCECLGFALELELDGVQGLRRKATRSFKREVKEL